MEKEIKQEQSPVAEFEVGGSIAFRTHIDDIIDDDEDQNLIDDRNAYMYNVDEDEDEDTEDTDERDAGDDSSEGDTETSEEETEEQEESSEDQDETDEVQDITGEKDESDSDNYDDYSEAALFALALNQRRPGIFDKTEKDLDPSKFVEELDKYIGKVAEATMDNEINRVGEAREYLQLLLNSNNVEQTAATIRQASQLDQFANLDIEQAEDGDLEGVVRSMYTQKGVEPEDIDEMVESLKDTNKLKTRAKTAVKFHSTLKNDMIERDRKEQEYYMEQVKAAQEKQREDISSIITSGSISGIALDETSQQDFSDWLNNPTEIVELPHPQTGEMVRQRVTKAHKAQMEFNQDLEKQLAFYLLLKDGFDLTNIKNQAKVERDNEFLNVLNKRKNKSTKQNKDRRTTTRNAYYG